MARLKIGFFGFGYVAATLTCGIERVKAGEIDLTGVPLENRIPGCNVEEIEVVCGFDVDKKKIGKDVSSFISMYPELKTMDSFDKIKIHQGVNLNSAEGMPFKTESIDDNHTLYECAKIIVERIIEEDLDCTITVTATEEIYDVDSVSALEAIIKEDRKDKITASMFYAYCAFLAAKKRERGIVHINGIPSKIANSPVFSELSEKSGSVLIGDDISSGQSRLLSDLMEHYKEINRTILSAVGANWGGNMDFYRLQDEKRNESKKITKTGCAKDILGYDMPSDIKPHAYLQNLGDKKAIFMHFPMKLFNGAEDEIYICGRINDSPAAAGMLIDMGRLGALAVSRGESGVNATINSFYCKWFGKQHSKILAYQKLIGWVKDN
ncbi:MAG: myo-inositol-1-phosphate synthase [Nanohaloarchaea archaeon]|nr:myo-inositol-1-phosphate synthase [Candidatus Nanohaloarchaea archaeon]